MDKFSMLGSVESWPVIQKMLERDRIARHLEFINKSGWTFDPSKFGFDITKRFNRGVLDRRQPDKFYWCAEKAINWNQRDGYSSYDVCDVFTIARNRRTEEYHFTRMRSFNNENVWSDYTPPTKTKNVVIAVANQEEAHEVLKSIGAFRKGK